MLLSPFVIPFCPNELISASNFSVCRSCRILRALEQSKTSGGGKLSQLLSASHSSAPVLPLRSSIVGCAISSWRVVWPCSVAVVTDPAHAEARDAEFGLGTEAVALAVASANV